ncbi:hypothetical protein BDV95DRAFT_506531, partial [Massariosphaeria phaeospora]
MPYDRATVVACLTRHFDILIRTAYLPASSVRRPPPTGWSDADLAVDVLRALGRSEMVIDLLRYLPYLPRPDEGVESKWEVWPETEAISYLRDGGNLGGVVAEECRGVGKVGMGMGWVEMGLMPKEGEWREGMVSLSGGRH